MPIFVFLATVFLCVSDAIGWDIAVITKEDIEFFKNGFYLGVGHGYLKDLSVAAYDPIHGYLYISDSSHPNASIFRLQTQNSEDIDPSSVVFEAVVSKQSSVQGITYDPISSALFWTTGSGNTILKLIIRPGNETKITVQRPGTVLHQFNDGTVPRGIAVHSCTETLYWTNIKPLAATIEKSRFDGSERAVVVSSQTNSNVKIFQPYGIEVDEEMKKLYWCDAFGSNTYQIVRSDLNGANTVIVVSHSGQEPYGISIAQELLFWTDAFQGQLFSLPKNTVNASQAKLVKKFGRTKRPDGIISNTLYLNVKTDLCPQFAPLLPQIQRLYETESPILSHTSSSPSNDSNDLQCLNGGRRTGSTCLCPKGFTGAVCELSLCYNYCLSGICLLNPSWTPSCKCDQGWTGTRCELNPCNNHCLNGGRCDLDTNGEAVCQCVYGYSGHRCEIQTRVTETMCKMYCQVHATSVKFLHPNASVIRDFKDAIEILFQSSFYVCNCAEFEETSSSDNVFHFRNDTILLILILGCSCILLSSLVLFITSKYLRLRKRPRIHKRIVVNRPSLTPSCRLSETSEPCQITIENCCNMDICDTPCFKPEFSSSTSTVCKKNRSEDKQNLIGDQEEDNQ